MKIFSIIIPVYKDIRILSAIESVIKADSSNITRIYVINGGVGYDGNEKISKSLRPWDMHLIEKDKGVFDALNKGLDKSKEGYIGWLGSDDKIPNNFSYLDAYKFLLTSDLVIYNTDHVRDGKFVRRSKARHLKDIRMGYNNPHFSTFLRRSVIGSERFNLNHGIVADILFFQNILSPKSLRSIAMNEVGCIAELGGLSNSGFSRILFNNLNIFILLGRERGWLKSLCFVLRKILSKVLPI
jgi:glycosyltransferase involved in cell wall biosynthesis